MKKFFCSLIIFALCFILCGCSLITVFSPVQLEAHTPQVCRVYVCGAVENEGFVEMEEGASVLDAIVSAGLIIQSVLPEYYLANVSLQTTCVAVNYAENGNTYFCINLNSSEIVRRSSFENIDESVIQAIADYLTTVGKITNKNQLKEILGDKYETNYYKFFVSEADYEAID